MKIPDNIEHQHILKALEEIARRGTESIPRKRFSTRYDLLHEKKKFPPKYVISLANKFVNHVALPSQFNGGSPTNNFLEARGFEVVDKAGKPWGFYVDAEYELKNFQEGTRSYRLHLSIERDSRVSKLAKEKRWGEAGLFACDICGFDFEKSYGKRGYKYIEAHHTVPVSEMKKGQKTKLKDIALVCSNCHKILHKSRPWLSIQELIEIMQANDSRRMLGTR
jgi:5-methylcytosine-specific restriction endonuclease McrA